MVADSMVRVFCCTNDAIKKSITRCRQNNAKRGILAVIAISNVCHNLMKSRIGGEMDLKT